MQKYGISAGQIIGMMFWTIMGTAVISLPVTIGLHAPRDAWAAAVLFTIGGMALGLIVEPWPTASPERISLFIPSRCWGHS